MSIAPIQPEVLALAPPVTRPVLGTRPESTAPFADALRAAGPDGSDREQDARMVAEQLVATTFIQPVLAMLHETNQAAGPFAPSSTERRFTPMLDQHLSERIVHGSRFPLVDRIAERLLRGGSGSAGSSRASSIERRESGDDAS